jgi:hypothetical protein
VQPCNFSPLCATPSLQFPFFPPAFSPVSFTFFHSRSGRVLESRNWAGSEPPTCAGSGVKSRWAIRHYGPEYRAFPQTWS